MTILNEQYIYHTQHHCIHDELLAHLHHIDVEIKCGESPLSVRNDNLEAVLANFSHNDVQCEVIGKTLAVSNQFVTASPIDQS